MDKVVIVALLMLILCVIIPGIASILFFGFLAVIIVGGIGYMFNIPEIKNVVERIKTLFVKSDD